MPKLGKSEGEGEGREGEVPRRSLEGRSYTELRGCRLFFSVQLHSSKLLRGTLLKGGTEERSCTEFFYCLIKLVTARPKGPSNTNV
jgi:hypothetical protein